MVETLPIILGQFHIGFLIVDKGVAGEIFISLRAGSSTIAYYAANPPSSLLTEP